MTFYKDDIDLRTAFRGKRVFITGHTGFKGSWLAIWLNWLGAKVFGYSLDPPTKPSNYEVCRLDEFFTASSRGDIRNRKLLSSAIRTAQPDFIFHLAAQPIVRDSYLAPLPTWETNVMGTATLLETIRLLGYPCTVIVVSSDKCYENRAQTGGYREDDHMGGFDPYSASKGAAELLVSSYRRCYFPPEKINKHGVGLATVRAGNVIGGGDWGRDRIVTDIVLSLSRHQPIPVRNPHAVRPWQHVLEPLSGYLLLASQIAERREAPLCSAWNFGPPVGVQTRVMDLVEAFCRQWGSDSRWELKSHPDAPHEAELLELNIDKAVSELGWRPRWSVAQAVKRTVAWYRTFYDSPGPQMLGYCIKDIEAFSTSL